MKGKITSKPKSKTILVDMPVKKLAKSTKSESPTTKKRAVLDESYKKMKKKR